MLAGAAALAAADRANAGCPCAAPPDRIAIRTLVAADVLPERSAGKPGDFLLSSPAAQAVVRGKDGTLVDFFRVPPALPTSPQLGAERFLDGLTLFRPFVAAGARRVQVAGTPRALNGRVELTQDVMLAGARLRVTTAYRLSEDEPVIDVTTTVEHVGGHGLETLSVGERVRWGNSDYFVDGKRGKPSYSGRAFAVGRKGAGGDLVLLPASGRMQILYQSTQPGLMGELSAQHGTFPLGKGQTKVVRRSLAYRPLHEPSPKPASALLEAAISDERGRPLAGKLTFRGLGATPDPDFGNDGDERGANRFVYSGNGRVSRSLSPGRYRVLASAGIERDIASFDVELAAGRTERREVRLPRVIETPGRIAADLHLHQSPSPDADISNATRVISIAAEGIEFAVASDHYTVGDLGPALTRLRDTGALVNRMIVMRGSEVTTMGHDFGHFNVFPLDSTAGIPYEDTTPRELFGAVRKVAPNSLLQVNHPRWQKSYFSRYALDPKLGTVRPSLAGDYSTDFDALEVFNGFDAWSQALVRNVLRDYLHLVARGKRYTATGNSDSHGLFFVDPGMPRNLIAYGTAANDDADLDAEPRAVIDAIRRGNVTVTNGPVLDIDVNGVGPGGTVKTGGRPVKLHVVVRAAPWIDVTTVEILRGRGERVRNIPVLASREPLRLDYSTTLPGDGSTFFVVIARGKRDLPNVYRPEVRPFAFSNPIFIER